MSFSGPWFIWGLLLGLVINSILAEGARAMALLVSKRHIRKEMERALEVLTKIEQLKGAAIGGERRPAGKYYEGKGMN